MKVKLTDTRRTKVALFAYETVEGKEEVARAVS